MNTPPPLPATPAAPRKSGLGIASLVLGILSLPICLYIFTGLPAIITGHMARSRAKKQPQLYGGAGMALAGLILGYLSILTTIAGVIILVKVAAPAIAEMQQHGPGFRPGPPPPTTCV